MAEKHFSKVYEADPDALTDLYDDWADDYDADLASAGYATPARVARALARLAPDGAGPVMDFGCGTGLSGAALAEAGFTQVDGCDLSAGMLDEARAKDIYRDLYQLDAAAPPPFSLGLYPVVAATGVISVGGAPASVLGEVAREMAPGALLGLSFNDPTLDDADYTDTLARLVEAGTFRIRHEEHGDHLPAKGMKSTVYVLERL